MAPNLEKSTKKSGIVLLIEIVELQEKICLADLK